MRSVTGIVIRCENWIDCVEAMDIIGVSVVVIVQFISGNFAWIDP